MLGSSTLHSCGFVLDVSGIFYICFRVVLGLILEAILALVLGSIFGALGVQHVSKVLLKIDSKFDIETNGFRGRPSTNEIPGLVARRG